MPLPGPRVMAQPEPDTLDYEAVMRAEATLGSRLLIPFPLPIPPEAADGDVFPPHAAIPSDIGATDNVTTV